MPSGGASDGAGVRLTERYALGPSVRLTKWPPGGAEPDHAFLRTAQGTGLFRLGREELFLFERLAEGDDLRHIAEAFDAKFGRSVRVATIERFAADMVKAGALIAAEEAEVIETAAGRPPRSGGPSRPASPREAPRNLPIVIDAEAEPDEDEVEAGSGFGGGAGFGAFDDFLGDTDSGDDLEDMIFGDASRDSRKGAGARRRGPGQGSPGSPTGGSTGSAEGGARNAAAPGVAESDAEGDEDPARHADPDVARRKVKFKPDAGAAGAKSGGGRLHLFDPTLLFGVLSGLFGWTRHLLWLFYPMSLFAALTLFHRLTEMGLSLAEAEGTLNMVGRLAVSLLTVNLFARIVTGTVAVRQGARVPSFGLVFVGWVIPFFSVDLTGVMRLEREQKLRVYAAPLLARLFLFILGTILWAVTRQSATQFSELALLVAHSGLAIFLITALPLVPADGYKWIATYFNQPMLRQRAFAYVFGGTDKGHRLAPKTSMEKWAFVLYAVGSALFMVLIGVMASVYLTTALEGRFRGSGVIMFLGVFALLVTWFLAMKAMSKKVRREVAMSMVAERVGGGGAARAGAGAAAAEGAGGPRVQGRALVKRPEPETKPSTARRKPLPGVYAYNARKARMIRWAKRIFWVAVLGVVAFLAFQPYPYEVGGDFIILPNQRTEIVARVSGELTDILVDEGDEVVEGQLIGRLLDRQTRRNFDVTTAELAKARAALQRLMEGATAEEIQLAREQVALAEAAVPFRKAQAERADTLLKRKIIAETEAERLKTDYLVAQQELQTAKANLAKVEAGATGSEIAIAQAEVDRLQAELAFNELQLRDTEIRATVAGRIVTENLALDAGKFLEKGAVFVEIEDHLFARAEVEVSETDIGLVEVGTRVRLKAWASSHEESIGEVVAIAPVAKQKEFGRVVRVKTQIPNADGFFRPEMTGFAKIEGAEMPAWEAYTRLFDRFFRIEVWSWIP